MAGGWKSIRRMSSIGSRLAHDTHIKRLMQQADSVTEVSAREEAAQLRYWEQGCAEMYTLENVHARFANRSSDEIWHYLNNWWWRTACKFASADNEEATAEMSRWTLPHNAYVAMLTRIRKALLEEGEKWDLEEATRLAEESWLADVKGSASLGRTEFCDGLFELADVWTHTTAVAINTAEHCTFSLQPQ